MQHLNISDDIDLDGPNTYNEPDCFDEHEEQMRVPDSLKKADDDFNILKYCIIASLALHLMLFASLTRVADLTPTKALLKPGETVTSVRLVEPPPQEKVPEPPPQQAAAISDRDHTAEKQWLPKMMPAPQPPLGKLATPQPAEKRIASLSPPVAPEDVAKTEPEVAKEKEPKKPAAHDKSHKKELDKSTPETKAAPKARNLRNMNVDLNPTAEEVARGLSNPGGSADFFPDGDSEEVVVDINTREEKFFSYLLHLKKKIQGVWVYPTSAARSGIGGALVIEFSVANNGELLYANLLDSSGHSVLDRSALAAVKAAAPYFPFPPRMKAKRLRIRANFIYVTSSYFRSIM